MSGEVKDRSTHSREREKKKQEFGEQVKKQDVTVKDKAKGADTAAKLRQEGTRDGARAVAKAIEQAAKAIDQMMDKQKGEHDTKAGEGKQVEGRVGKAADASKQDSRAADQAARDIHTDGGKRAVQEAGKAAAEDDRWLSDLKKNRERERESSEKKTTEQLRDVKGRKMAAKQR